MKITFSSLISTLCDISRGMRYLAVLDFVNGPRLQESYSARTKQTVDTGFPELGMREFFKRDGASWGVMFLVGGFASLFAYGAVGTFVASLLYPATHRSLSGVVYALAGIGIAALLGGVGGAVLYYSIAYVRKAGVDARSELSAQKREVFQRVLALHASDVTVPATVRTCAEAVEFAAGFRRRLAQGERSKLAQIRAVIEESAVASPAQARESE